MADMEVDVFKDCSYGKLALAKLAPVGDDFRLFYAGWLGDSDRSVMKVVGADFRRAKSGKNKGKLCILVTGTQRGVYITADEMRQHKE